MHNDVLYALEYILIFVLIGACDLLNYMGMDFMDVSYSNIKHTVTLYFKVSVLV